MLQLQMLWITLFLIISCNFCSAQDFNSSFKFNETDEDANCITEYIDLEKLNMSWIMKTWLKNLQRLSSLYTGRAAAAFVKITYNFRTCYNNQPATDNISNCSSQHSTYIWSETALYLLGPRAMFWYTLFAVNICEVDVTVELPCLCGDAYNDLLSRLTYLVCIYKFNNLLASPTT